MTVLCSFNVEIRLFGWQFRGWAAIRWVAILRPGCDYLGGDLKAGIRSFRWQLCGWDESLWVAALMLGLQYLGGRFMAGMRLLGWQF
jgi:hypothetical protein